MTCQGKAGMHLVKPMPHGEAIPDIASLVCPECGDTVTMIRDDVLTCRCGFRWRCSMAMDLA